MTVVAVVKTPLSSVDRKADGQPCGISTGHINGVSRLVTLTVTELHIGYADRAGPAFVINLNLLLKAAFDEIEELLGQKAVTR